MKYQEKIQHHKQNARKFFLAGVAMCGSYLLFDELFIVTGGFIFLGLGISQLLKSKKKPKQVITIAQIEALLRRTNNRITIQNLAQLTKTSPEFAEQKLQEFVMDNLLDAEIDGTEVVYRRKTLY